MMLGTCAQRGSSETAACQRGQQRFVVGEDEQGMLWTKMTKSLIIIG